MHPQLTDPRAEGCLPQARCAHRADPALSGRVLPSERAGTMRDFSTTNQRPRLGTLGGQSWVGITANGEKSALKEIPAGINSVRDTER